MREIHVPLHVDLLGLSWQQVDPEESEAEIVSSCFILACKNLVSAFTWFEYALRYLKLHLCPICSQIVNAMFTALVLVPQFYVMRR